MREEQVGDGRGLLDGGQVRGAGDEGEPGVGYPGDERAGLGGSGDVVLGTHEDEGGDADTPEFGADVEGGQRLARGDVAAGIGRAYHLDGPFDDGRLGGREAGGEPCLGGGPGHRLQAVGADDHAALTELVGAAEPGRGRDEGERGDPVGVAQREIGADRAADGAAGVPEALDAEAVEHGEQTVGEGADAAGGVRGGAAVAREVVPEHPPVPAQLGYLPVPHVQCGTQRRPDHQDRSVFWPVKAVLHGVRWCNGHPENPLICHEMSHRRGGPSQSRLSHDASSGAGTLKRPAREDVVGHAVVGQESEARRTCVVEPDPTEPQNLHKPVCAPPESLDSERVARLVH
ncbi:hypothetical protein Sfulv_50490 [Streptomyces fulvorobeus]|uniref:Uncharacterized protein n=1 Tax=Streptomyces fulvorobeus TaxID=284028 RepID=A0A7J0CCV6_9ACTN|nr:hypothetical protein Sfulv_50490 [Streptomyces fulvorobeus]